MIFKNNITYKSTYGGDEILERLKAITGPKNSSDKIKFEGQITNKNFRLLPTFNFGPNNQLRPEIIGRLIQNEIDTDVILLVKLPRNLKILLYFALVFNLCILTITIFFPDQNFIPLCGKWWVDLSFLILMFLFLGISFLLKKYETLNFLKKYLDLN